ncbi:hypothetical protein MRX96_032696 [Rhipicephalus microplus]
MEFTDPAADESRSRSPSVDQPPRCRPMHAGHQPVRAGAHMRVSGVRPVTRTRNGKPPRSAVSLGVLEPFSHSLMKRPNVTAACVSWRSASHFSFVKARVDRTLALCGRGPWGQGEGLCGALRPGSERIVICMAIRMAQIGTREIPSCQ